MELPLPTYTQDDVMALGRSFTGWTYPTEPGQTLTKTQSGILRREHGGVRIEPRQRSQDVAGAIRFRRDRRAEQELDSVLAIIFNHPNLPPFVAQQLIEKLVTSNPSPAM